MTTGKWRPKPPFRKVNCVRDKPSTKAIPRLEDRTPVRALRGVNRLFCSTYHQLTIQSPCRLPRSGPAILVCNHMSGLDPLLLQAMSTRVVVWMMAKEYYEIKALAWFFRMIEAIPVSRNGRDAAATRSALRALEKGNVLGIFPEGRIETTRDLLPFQTGVAMMAIKTGVPIYPAYIDGTTRGKEMLVAFRTASHNSIRFGREIVIPRHDTSRETLETATQLIRSTVDGLKRAMEATPGR
jgi:1-acyl-sn-glycerol-3-phosphate acyltransferase